MPRTLLFCANDFPHPVAEFLSENGYTVLEANSDAELQNWLRTCPEVDAVLFAHGSRHIDVDDLRQRRITIDLTIQATGSDVYFELSHLFSPATLKV